MTCIFWTVEKGAPAECLRGGISALGTDASNALAAGISLDELSRYTGASVRVIEAHYAHLVPAPKTLPA